MISRSCLLQRTARSYLSAFSQRPIPNHDPIARWTCRRNLHISQPCRDSHSSAGLPNHYETLDLPTNASPGEIKKQFYALSKSHHPDLHPNDSTASQRFVKISEAYATLGSPEERERYDRDFLRVAGGPTSTGVPRGSYSSASSSVGGRPASGLSKRRTKFQGPPPSFYQRGGWGAYGAKREEAARNASHSHEAQGKSQSGPSGPAGTGPGGFAMGQDNDVPHFDQKGHYQTHSNVEKTRHRARRKQERTYEDVDLNAGGGMLYNFFVVSGMLGLIYILSLVVGTAWSSSRRSKQKVES